MPPAKILNVAAYKFVSLDNLKELRETVRRKGKPYGLKGTILLSPEGINLFLAGESKGLYEFLHFLSQETPVGELETKESWTEGQPFRRFLVKLKREIIAFGQEGIDPSKYTSPRIEAKELKAWLDEGKKVHLLDVRNDYEVEVGTFTSATAVGVDQFREFPEALDSLPAEWRDEPIVTFCTGGIRCEKAAPFMEQQGFSQVYQLEGGILKYFEEVGQDHYQGECFVFDHRVTVDAALEASDKRLCFACQAVLTPEDCESPLYVPNESCPHCFQKPQESLEVRLKQRLETWNHVVSPLPGAEPYDHERPLRVSQKFADITVHEFVRQIRTHLSVEQWENVVEKKQLLRRGTPVQLDDVTRAGDILVHLQPAYAEPEISTQLSFLDETDEWVVVDKPAPLPMHASGRFYRHTLTYLLDQVYAPERLRPVHRLDAATTGVVILARNRRSAAALQQVFEAGEADKTYLVRVHGHADWDRFECDQAISSEPIDGLRRLDPDGLPSKTIFEVIDRFDDGTSLLKASPVTGRTNQIRIHAWSLGLPVVGDPMYLVGGETKNYLEPATTQDTLCLHAWKLRFPDPFRSGEVEFTAPQPTWAEFRNSAYT